MNRKTERNDFSSRVNTFWIVPFHFVDLFRVILHEVTQRQKKDGSSKQDDYFSALVTYIILGSSVAAKFIEFVSEMFTIFNLSLSQGHLLQFRLRSHCSVSISIRFCK